MKNRAKCKICQTIIQSFHSTDYQECSCGEIAVDKGDAFICYANDFNNFLRVDDEGNEIIVKIIDKSAESAPSEHSESETENKPHKAPPTKQEIIKIIQGNIESVERLPEEAMNTYLTQYDYLSLLFLLLSIFKVDLPDEPTP